jgi:hypothetical protein
MKSLEESVESYRKHKIQKRKEKKGKEKPATSLGVNVDSPVKSLNKFLPLEQ